MSRTYDVVFDKLFTRIDAETAHRAAFRAIRAAGPLLAPLTPRRTAVSVMGLDFPGVLGLAAGFDKNAVGIDALAGLGFGFIEIGTVTGEPQPGNPRPRLARLPQDAAIVNRMGFNNDGAEAVAARLQRRRDGLDKLDQRAGVYRRAGADRRGGGLDKLDQRAGVDRRAGADRRGGGLDKLDRRAGADRRVGADRAGVDRRARPVLGINIGKTKVVPEDDQAAVVADYEKSTRLLAPFADYLVVNVSSPNTPGLRNLQSVERLQPLLEAVRRKADESTIRRVPLLVKIAPDLADEDVLAVADMAVTMGLDGIIATNTTISREGLSSPAVAIEAAGGGGLSGAPLEARATEVIRMLRGRVGSGFCLIGVGGIHDAVSARARLEAGADLLQAYTGFVYGGPGWPRRMNKSLTTKSGARR